MSSSSSTLRGVGDWIRVVLRVVVVTVTLYPALRKFFEYSYRVERFDSYGIPWPELAVPLTGVVEVAAIVMIAGGIAGRLGAASLVFGMIVAILTAGLNPANAIVLLGSLAIVVSGTGPYSYWDPTIRDLLDRDDTLGQGVPDSG